MNLYIDYSEFELTCWNTDGKGTNVAIPLTEEQAKKICDIIGLLGFAEENGKIVGYHRARRTTEMLTSDKAICRNEHRGTCGRIRVLHEICGK